MKNFLVSLYFLFPTIILVLLNPIPSAQLTTTETRILLQLQTLLEYPQVLQQWNNLTNFCNISSSPSLNIVCSKGHVTELTIIGNKNTSKFQRTMPSSWNSNETLSQRFSIDSFFTVLTKLSNMKVLSLVSLGLWGPLPSKISRFNSLEVFNITSNFMYGKIPSSISSLKNLKSLVLADNFFNGSVPNLKRLVSLEEINFGYNKLGPEFPSIENNLVSIIILKNNSLKTQIPHQLIHVEKLQLFDVSSNEIFGNIPSFLFSLPFLQHLNLASNQLSGSVSVNISCSSALTFVDISHNFLEGNLPSCFDSKSSNRTIVYAGNCLSTRNFSDQNPSSYCKKSTALVAKPRFKRWRESKFQLGVIIGLIGVFVGIAGLLILLFLFILRKSKAKREDSKIDNRVSVTTYSRPNIYARSIIPQLMRITALGLPPYKIFTIEEIEDATKYFDSSNLIGEGSQGMLYKGRLRDDSMVMVNLVKLKQKSLTKISDQNLKVLPYLRHRHLVSVLGHCEITYQDHPKKTSTILIVFEHISNMSLRIHLTDRRKKELLKWQQRMAIIIGIARGIKFLHAGLNPGIFGNNIKIENILLDDSLNPKVSGYSIPFPSKKGSERKLKEQNSHNHFGSINNAEKEDIYQLGVILLEVITGKLITSSIEVEVLKYELERGLSEFASSPTTLRSAIDHSLNGTYTHESLKTAVQMTIKCLSKVPGSRPSIEDILWNLQYSMQVQEARSSKSSKTSA